MMKHKRIWLGLALALSVALNTLMPYFAHYGQEGPPSQLASIFGDKVLICSDGGFVWVKWSDLAGGKAPVKQHKEFFCPLCYVASSALAKSILPDGAAPLAFYAAVSGAPPIVFTEHVPAQWMREGLYSRAPPV